MLTTTTEPFTTTRHFRTDIIKCSRLLKYLGRDGNSKTYREGNIVTAGLADTDLNLLPTWSKLWRIKAKSFPHCLLCSNMERLNQNVGFDTLFSPSSLRITYPETDVPQVWLSLCPIKQCTQIILCLLWLFAS